MSPEDAAASFTGCNAYRAATVSAILGARWRALAAVPWDGRRALSTQPLQGRAARVLAIALPSGTVFWNFKLREGMKFSDATASPLGALFWNRMVTCTDSSSRDVLTVPCACVAKLNILALRGS